MKWVQTKQFIRRSRLIHFDDRLHHSISNNILLVWDLQTEQATADVTNVFMEPVDGLLGVMVQFPAGSLYLTVGSMFSWHLRQILTLHLHISENELCLTLYALHLWRLVSVVASDLWWQQCSPAGLLMLFTICCCVWHNPLLFCLQMNHLQH